MPACTHLSQSPTTNVVTRQLDASNARDLFGSPRANRTVKSTSLSPTTRMRATGASAKPVNQQADPQADSHPTSPETQRVRKAAPVWP